MNRFLKRASEKGGLLAWEIPVPVFVVVVALLLVTLGWFIWSRTDVSGARNPPGTPGNTDPYLSGDNPVLRPAGGGGPPNRPDAGAPGSPRQSGNSVAPTPETRR